MQSPLAALQYHGQRHARVSTNIAPLFHTVQVHRVSYILYPFSDCLQWISFTTATFDSKHKWQKHLMQSEAKPHTWETAIAFPYTSSAFAPSKCRKAMNSLGLIVEKKLSESSMCLRGTTWRGNFRRGDEKLRKAETKSKNLALTDQVPSFSAVYFHKQKRISSATLTKLQRVYYQLF